MSRVQLFIFIILAVCPLILAFQSTFQYRGVRIAQQLKAKNRDILPDLSQSAFPAPPKEGYDLIVLGDDRSRHAFYTLHILFVHFIVFLL
jgi:hypothetical protein